MFIDENAKSVCISDNLRRSPPIITLTDPVEINVYLILFILPLSQKKKQTNRFISYKFGKSFSMSLCVYFEWFCFSLSLSFSIVRCYLNIDSLVHWFSSLAFISTAKRHKYLFHSDLEFSFFRFSSYFAKQWTTFEECDDFGVREKGAATIRILYFS